MSAPDNVPGDLSSSADGVLSSDELRTLYALCRRIAGADDAAAIYRIITEGVALLGARECAVYAGEASGIEGLLQLVAGHGLPTLPQPRGAARSVASQDADLDAMIEPLAQLWQASGQATLTIELAQISGADIAHRFLVSAWPVDRPVPRAALVALVDDANTALQRIGRAVGSVSQVGDPDGILAAINAVTDIGLLYSNLISQLLNEILVQILEVVHLASGAIFIYSEHAEQLDLAVYVNGPEGAGGAGDLTDLWRPPLLWQASEQAQETARNGQVSKTLAIASAGDARPVQAAMRSALQSVGAGAIVSVPLIAGGWLTGVLQVVTLPGKMVSERQIGMLRILARQTAVAIENARLFAQTRTDQERTRAVVDATNDAILMIDERRRTMIINRRARFFFGLSERDMLSKDFEQLSALFTRIFEEPQRFKTWLSQLLYSSSDRAVEEFRIIRPESRLLQCFSAPVMDVHDRYLGRILVFRDITREREVERMKSDFVSIVSHELRTPLTSIQGALQLVLGQPRTGKTGLGEGMPPRARDLLSISLANSERLIRLINDILDVAKIEQGRIQLRREPLNPEELCRNAAAEMSAFANNRGISIEMDLPPWLPRVNADRDRSVQVLVNLLSNAIKFSPSGQRVALSVRYEGAMVCFTVQDWGRGIAPEDQQRLFQKFSQIDSSATRDVGGTGLGLAISRALVEEQGGRIWLESTPGQGSIFRFTLPALENETDAAGGSVARPRVLVVDDDPHVRPVLVRMLERQSMQVTSVGDGLSALEMAEARQPELILLDVKMPGIDGIEVLRRLRKNSATANIPVIILTANDLDETLQNQALDLGADGYLEKPISSERLVSAIGRVIGQNGSRNA